MREIFATSGVAFVDLIEEHLAMMQNHNHVSWG